MNHYLFYAVNGGGKKNVTATSIIKVFLLMMPNSASISVLSTLNDNMALAFIMAKIKTACYLRELLKVNICLHFIHFMEIKSETNRRGLLRGCHRRS